ncbi:hypothetical protein SLS54_009801 [Diplodia seriata]
MGNKSSSYPDPTPEQLQRISAPFATWNPDRMDVEINDFVAEAGLQDDKDYIRRGAKLAQDKDAFNVLKRPHDALPFREDLDEEKCLQWESQDKGRDRFRQTWKLYTLVIMCSIGAAVQGWDESAVSSAQIYYQYALDIQGTILGLVNAAPYLCCAVTCWLNYPLNKVFGRRGTIFLTCFISFVTCLGQGFAQTWQQLFVARLLLGFGIGPKRDLSRNGTTATGNYTLDPHSTQNYTYYGHGTLPPQVNVSGAGNIQLTNVTNTADLLATNCSLNWRMMLAAPMILPLVVMAYIYTVPESPRWLLQKAHDTKDDIKKRKLYQDAWGSLCLLRHTKLQAARDLFLIHHRLKNEQEIFETQRGLKQLFGLKQLHLCASEKVYSAESMPLHNRDLGMGIATAVLWLFNAVLAITYPQFLKTFTAAGTFGWYAGWCFVGWFMILLYVKGPTLVHADGQVDSEDESIDGRSESRGSEEGHEMHEVRPSPSQK